MKKCIIPVVIALAMALSGCIMLSGCATKTRTVELAGMWASESGQLAIGKVEVQAIPEGTDAALIKYSEDNAWLSPTMKLHEIGITLTGSNSVEKANAIVDSICKAFIKAGPSLAESETKKNYGTTQVDVLKNATEARKSIELGKQLVDSSKVAAAKEVDLAKLAASTNAISAAAASTAADCADGSCTDGECTDGSCTAK